MRVIIPFGPPGVGKGTQASLLAEKCHIPHISTGELFRENIRQETPLGIEAKEYIEKGVLGPDSLVLDMLQMRIKEKDAKEGFILDGYPRTVDQATVLDEIISPESLYIFYFNAPKEMLIERISGRLICSNCQSTYHSRFKPPKEENTCDICGEKLYQRKDDRPEVIEKRLDEYDKKTAPVIEYYKKRAHFYTIDCTQTIEKIEHDLATIIEAT